MPLISAIAGPYTGTYNSVDTGITEDGYTLTVDSSVQAVSPTDAYGDSVIDTIYRGGNCFLQFTSKEFKAGSVTPFWPYGTIGAHGQVGRLGSALAAAMVLTVVAGTPAADSTPSADTLTATLAILAENSNLQLMFDSRLRTVPIRLRLLPSVVSAVNKWFALA